jgi:hypothetical protein
MTDVVREHAIDERLVPDTPALGFLTEAREDGGVQSNRNQLARVITERRAADAPHRAKLSVRRLRHIREINLPRRLRTLTFLFGSLAAR